MPQLVNWELLANPLNWIVVALMLAIAAFGLHLLLSEDGGFVHHSGSAGL